MAFVAVGTRVERREPLPDPTGHGSRLAGLLQRDRTIDLLLGQAFTTAAPTTGAAVAAAVDWAVEEGANLVHLSLGLAADRPVLREAVARALAGGVVLVAAMPARSTVASVYPAAYDGVIRGTGDARCAPGEISSLGAELFGACPRLPASCAGERSVGRKGGASVGAAWLSWSLAGWPPPATARAATAVAALLAGAASYRGRECR
jgi:hypothetical protein